MSDKSYFWDFLAELSPFKIKYFFFVFIFVIVFVAIHIPLDSYSGITPSSRSDLLDVQYRILIDISFLATFIANIYLLIVYYLKGVSRQLSKKLEKSIEQTIDKRGQEKKSSFKEMILFNMIYLISFFGFFLMPPSTSIKYRWMNQGNIYLDFLILYILCLGFIVLNLFLIISREANKNGRTRES
ncbi:hypothetical protein [Acinetobacter bereziniae]|uniref:hypothetical protein n=1 Tax=Acinetobacter bereziniae TaxID=106648 RepID=UPI0032157F5E